MNLDIEFNYLNRKNSTVFYKIKFIPTHHKRVISEKNDVYHVDDTRSEYGFIRLIILQSKKYRGYRYSLVVERFNRAIRNLLKKPVSLSKKIRNFRYLPKNLVHSILTSNQVTKYACITCHPLPQCDKERIVMLRYHKHPKDEWTRIDGSEKGTKIPKSGRVATGAHRSQILALPNEP